MLKVLWSGIQAWTWFPEPLALAFWALGFFASVTTFFFFWMKCGMCCSLLIFSMCFLSVEIQVNPAVSFVFLFSVLYFLIYSLCSPGWFWTCDHPDSVSPVLGAVHHHTQFLVSPYCSNYQGLPCTIFWKIVYLLCEVHWYYSQNSNFCY
jgi:hypothetical protein